MQEQENRPDRVETVSHSEPDYAPKTEKAGLKALIPNALVAVVVCGVLIFTGILPSAYALKTDVDAKLSSVVGGADGAKTSATNALIMAEGAVKDIKSVQADLKNYATQANLTAVQNSVNNIKVPDVTALTGQINTLSSKIDTLNKQNSDDQTTIQTLKTQIAALQASINTGSGGGTTPTTGTVTATVSTSSSIYGSLMNSFTIGANDLTPRSIQFNVKVTNGLNKQIKNLQLIIPVNIYSNGTMPSGTGSLTSNSITTWGNPQVYGSGSSITYVFYNSVATSWSTGIVVDAGATKTLNLWFTYTPTAVQAGTTLQFSPDVVPIDSSSYEVA